MVLAEPGMQTMEVSMQRNKSAVEIKLAQKLLAGHSL